MMKIRESRICSFAALVLLFSCLNISAQVSKKIRTIIVDAGHGGSDAGARAENEGSIPPNTAYMLVLAGRERVEVKASSDKKSNAAIVIQKSN